MSPLPRAACRRVAEPAAGAAFQPTVTGAGLGRHGGHSSPINTTEVRAHACLKADGASSSDSAILETSVFAVSNLTGHPTGHSQLPTAA